MMDSSIDPSMGVGSLKYPYPAHYPKSKFSFHFEEDSEGSQLKHLVVGHSQIRGKWNVEMTGVLNFPMDWICFSGGKAKFLGEEIIQILRANDDLQLRISAVIWQNSIEASSLEELMEIAKDITEEVKKYPQHKVGFPTLHLVPAQDCLWDKISKFNDFLRNLNIENGLNPYNLHKTTMRKVKGKGMKVVQTAWKEFNNNKSKGYHIDDHVTERYVKYIKTYHLHGFNDSITLKTSAIADQPKPVKCPYPNQLMKDPSSRDVRDVLNNIKSVKRDRYGNVVIEDELYLLRAEEERQLKRAKESIEEANSMIEVTGKQKVVLKKIMVRLNEWEKSSRAREKELIKSKKEMDAAEKDLECREAELTLREAMYKEKIKNLAEKKLRLNVEILEEEVEIARLKRERKKIKEMNKIKKKDSDNERKKRND